MSETTNKKTKKTPVATAEAAGAPTPAKNDKKAAKEAAARVAENDKFYFVGKPVEGAKKPAPQAQGIINIIEAAGKPGITRSELVKSMEGVITTKQPLGRILSYYQKPLIEGGYIRHEAASAA